MSWGYEFYGRNTWKQLIFIKNHNYILLNDDGNKIMERFLEKTHLYVGEQHQIDYIQLEFNVLLNDLEILKDYEQ